MSYQALLQVVHDTYPDEDERHSHEFPGGEAWLAQRDAFASRLSARLVEVIVTELHTALEARPNVICLHKGLSALSRTVQYLDEAINVMGRLFDAIEARYAAPHDERGEA